MRNTPLDFMMIAFAVWIAFLPIFVLAVTTDKIELTFNDYYLEEYNQCKLDLENMQPICPDCVCKSENDFTKYLIGVVIGAVFMCGIIQFIEYRKSKKKGGKKKKKNG